MFNFGQKSNLTLMMIQAKVRSNVLYFLFTDQFTTSPNDENPFIQMIQTGSTTDTPNLSPTEGINNSSQQSDYLFKNSLEEHEFGSLPIKIDQIFSSIPKETIDDSTKLKQFYAVEAKLSSESPKLAEQWRKEGENYSPEKGWSCNLCGKTLSCKQSLQKHLKIHTGVKPHKVFRQISRVFLTLMFISD